MSGRVTCSSSPSLAKALSLRACSRALWVSTISLRMACTAAITPLARGDLALHRLGPGAELGELLLEPGARVHAGLVVVVGERRDLGLERVDAAVHRVDLGGDAVDLDPLPGGGLVEQVDRGVGERAVGDVALGQGDGRDDGALADADAVVVLVLGGDAAEDLGRLLDAGRLQVDHREAADDAAVAVVHLAHALGGGGGDDADLAAREERLQQLAHARALHALPEEGVDVLDHEDALGVDRRRAACRRAP